MFVAGLRQPATGSDIRGLLGDHAGKLLFCRVWPSREALRNGSDQLVAHLQMADGADVEVVKGVLQSEPVLTAAVANGVLPERGGLLVETSLHRVGSTAFRVRVFLRHVLLLLELLQLFSLCFFVGCLLVVVVVVISSMQLDALRFTSSKRVAKAALTDYAVWWWHSAFNVPCTGTGSRVTLACKIAACCCVQ